MTDHSFFIGQNHDLSSDSWFIFTMKVCEIIWDLSKLMVSLPSSSVSTNIIWPNTQKSFHFVYYWNQLLDLVSLAKRETTQPCYMHFGNTHFSFRQKLVSNPRLNLISSCIFYHCFASVISCQLIIIIFMPSQLPPKHPSPDHLGNVHQIVLVTLWSIIKCNVWRFIYYSIFEGMYFLIVKDTMRNTAIHYTYTFSHPFFFMSTLERSVAPTCEPWGAAPDKVMDQQCTARFFSI